MVDLSKMPHATSPESSPDRAMDGVGDGAPSESHEMDTAADNATAVDTKELEGLFDDDDEDDEFSGSSAPTSSESTAPAAQASGGGNKYSDPDTMRAFYQRLFPYRQLFQWLNHSANPTTDFMHREFAFTLQGDIYLRYQSFANAEAFRKQCVAQIPSRFEIGPVYSTNPRDRKMLRRAAAFRPLSKELVFDIDMTDYDDIRTCCSKANICQRCWSFMRMAIRVLDTALREDFGYRHILWVYSGRRGVHAWVCDKRARDLSDDKRKSIATYLELLKGGDAGGKKVNIRRPLHPHLERSLEMLRENFRRDILHEQDPWADASKAAHLLSLLPDAELAKSLAKKWETTGSRSSENKWTDIDALASSGGASAAFDPKKLLEAKQDIVLEYTYPRLDAAVSKHLNHLLKSPFCVHPGTGRICVPIDPAEVDEFDPLDVPTVTELLAEVDGYQDDDAMDVDGEKRQADWEKTRLKPYVEYFRGFVNAMMKDEPGIKRQRAAGDGMEF